ncbi:carbohydrate binding domain-containing protein [Fulvivirga maritima]|uniref:carbohydrate binding domain-containing protein n=1 Tax=Fulvivirga maritima TaxID=2904247 RepID=UPI001F3DC849|nr:carbohydrate binding domain-containing protein [Fulvivirga maritima]UII27295.1 carbohydrate binding domain-containing protein [Fulvivirga maritima]
MKFNFKNIWTITCVAVGFIVLPACDDEHEEKLTGAAPVDQAVDVSSRITGFDNEVTGAGAIATVQGSSLEGVEFVMIDGLLSPDVEAQETSVAFEVPRTPAPSLGMVDVVLIFSGPERAYSQIEVVANPSVSMVYPMAGFEGDEISFIGTNLDAVAEAGIGSVAGSIVSSSAGMLTFTVPSGATDGDNFYLISSSGARVETTYAYVACESNGSIPACLEEINANGGFEAGDGSSLVNWNIYNTGNPSGDATVTVGSGPDEVLTGNYSMKVVNPTAYGSSQWRVQVVSDAFPTTSGKTYLVSYWVKAASDGGSIRLSSMPNASYQGDQTINSSWQEVTWSFTVTEPTQTATQLSFDMGREANTYFIDNVRVVEE